MTANRRGRKAGFIMPAEHRLKIRNSNILNALIEHVEGRREMSSTQVTAGLGLLRKVLPDLAAAADMDDAGQLQSLKSMSDHELEAIATGSSNGASPPSQGKSLIN